MKKFKKDLVSNITLICVLAFSGVHLLLLTLNLFNVTKFALPSGFSYIAAYVLMVLCFAFYVAAFFVENIKQLVIPTWLKVLFYVAFFVFTNVYYILGLYKNIISMLVFVAYIAFLLNIVALSIHFNVNKDEKNKLKSTTFGLIFNTSTYSVALSAFAIFILSIFKLIFASNHATLANLVFEMLTAFVVCTIIQILLAVSHKKSKKLINNCLVKIVPKTISPSVKG